MNNTVVAQMVLAVAAELGHKRPAADVEPMVRRMLSISPSCSAVEIAGAVRDARRDAKEVR